MGAPILRLLSLFTTSIQFWIKKMFSRWYFFAALALVYGSHLAMLQPMDRSIREETPRLRPSSSINSNLRPDQIHGSIDVGHFDVGTDSSRRDSQQHHHYYLGEEERGIGSDSHHIQYTAPTMGLVHYNAPQQHHQPGLPSDSNLAWGLPESSGSLGTPEYHEPVSFISFLQEPHQFYGGHRVGADYPNQGADHVPHAYDLSLATFTNIPPVHAALDQQQQRLRHDYPPVQHRIANHRYVPSTDEILQSIALRNAQRSNVQSITQDQIVLAQASGVSNPFQHVPFQISATGILSVRTHRAGDLCFQDLLPYGRQAIAEVIQARRALLHRSVLKYMKSHLTLQQASYFLSQDEERISKALKSLYSYDNFTGPSWQDHMSLANAEIVLDKIAYSLGGWGRHHVRDLLLRNKFQLYEALYVLYGDDYTSGRIAFSLDPAANLKDVEDRWARSKENEGGL